MCKSIQEAEIFNKKENFLVIVLAYQLQMLSVYQFPHLLFPLAMGVA